MNSRTLVPRLRALRAGTAGPRSDGSLPLKRYQFLPPKWLHDRLKWIKYAVFFGLVVVSLFSMGLVEKLAEVEPFKTTFLVGITKRSWPFATFVLVILGLSIFIERPRLTLLPKKKRAASPSIRHTWNTKRPRATTSTWTALVTPTTSKI